MCGISGIIHFDGEPVSGVAIRRMMGSMKYRGPDDEGLFLEGAVGLGFVRLSILDLSPAGRQPMFSADNRFVIVYNGEIFNYIELRKELVALGYTFHTGADTEVLLCAYQAWGKNMLHKLNGMWAFVIYDREEQVLFGARDRFGIKPFYYCLDGNRLLFASEIPPILAVLGRQPEPNHSAVFNFIAFNRTDQTDRTFFQEVNRLGHGRQFTISLREERAGSHPELSIQNWYDLRSELKNAFRSPDEFRELFTSSVGLRLRSDVPVGVCLSGGLDSSSIVSVLLREYGKSDVNTFSAVYGKGVFGDESDFIDLYRGVLKNMFFTQPDEHSLMRDIDDYVRAHAEPIPTTSPYAQFKVMELARQHVTVTLDGQGADEELAGYHYFFGYYFKDLLLDGRFARMARQMWLYFHQHHSLLGVRSLLFFLLPPNLRIWVMNRRKHYLDDGFVRSYAEEDMSIAGKLYGSRDLHEALINHFEYKLEHLLKWEDRNSMWFSIEARVPFLDYRLVERTLASSIDLILQDGVTKRILREAMKGILPEPIRLRKDKTGFETPQSQWFRKPAFRKYIDELISSPSFRSRGIMNQKRVRDIFRHHMDGKGDYGNEIWKWIHLENWYRQFIDA